MSNRGDDYFDDHYYELAEQYWNTDCSTLAELGEFVLNNPKVLTAFLEEWAKMPENEGKIRAWFDSRGEA